MDRLGDEEGASAVTAVFGVAIFLVFLLFAAQVLLHLYGTSTVTAVAFDSARLVAGRDGVSPAEAEARARAALGSYGSDPALKFTWQVDADAVVLRVDGPSPATLVTAVTGLAGLDAIEREVRVRVEDFRP